MLAVVDAPSRLDCQFDRLRPRLDLCDCVFSVGADSTRKLFLAVQVNLEGLLVDLARDAAKHRDTTAAAAQKKLVTAMIGEVTKSHLIFCAKVADGGAEDPTPVTMPAPHEDDF